jgi:negative regulator of replication initiation
MMSALGQSDARKGDRSATKVRAVRVSDDLWNAAHAKAAENGESISDVMRRALIFYTGLQGTTGVVGRADRQ